VLTTSDGKMKYNDKYLMQNLRLTYRILFYLTYLTYFWLYVQTRDLCTRQPCLRVTFSAISRWEASVLLKVAIFPLGTKYLEKTSIIGKRLLVYCLPRDVLKLIKSLNVT